jgi:hypothetical protein
VNDDVAFVRMATSAKRLELDLNVFYGAPKRPGLKRPRPPPKNPRLYLPKLPLHHQLLLLANRIWTVRLRIHDVNDDVAFVRMATSAKRLELDLHVFYLAPLGPLSLLPTHQQPCLPHPPKPLFITTPMSLPLLPPKPPFITPTLPLSPLGPPKPLFITPMLLLWLLLFVLR